MNQSNKDISFKLFNEDEKEDFSQHYQKKFIKAFIKNDKGFGERMVDIISIDYFDGLFKKILEYEINYFNKRRKIAKYDTLRDNFDFTEKGVLKEQLIAITNEIESLELEDQEEVEESAYTFFKKRSVKNTIYKLVENWHLNKWDDMKSLLESALKAGEPKEVGHNYFLDVNKRLSKDFRNPIPCLSKLSEDIGGGLAGGELGIVLAPPGGGKSMMLVKFASTALLEGKKVLYYSLELAEEVIGQRFDALMCDLYLKDVWEFKEHIVETLEEVAKKNGELVIKRFPANETTINSLISHLHTLESQTGFIPDIIFIDYADLMKPLSNYSEKRHAIDSICTSIRSLAVEKNIPIWTAAQTNRKALNEEKVKMDTIGESLGIAAIADVIIGVGRPDDLKEIDEALIGVIKNRNGRDGFYRPALFDTNRIFIKIKDVEAKDIMATSKKSKKQKQNEEEEELALEEIYAFMNKKDENLA